ncbi:MAG: septum formation initiator family protein [Alphaproteobacteria bacterium]|nr:septum formation initiator family protein [Alphaproteobacteria bacterium]
MQSRLEILQRLKDALVPGVVMLMVVYFGYHAVQGELGLVSYLKLQQQITELEAEAAVVAEERGALEQRVALMRSGNIDPDLLDEQARKTLGYAREDEVVLIDPEF